MRMIFFPHHGVGGYSPVFAVANESQKIIGSYYFRGYIDEKRIDQRFYSEKIASILLVFYFDFAYDFKLKEEFRCYNDLLRMQFYV